MLNDAVGKDQVKLAILILTHVAGVSLKESSLVLGLALRYELVRIKVEDCQVQRNLNMLPDARRPPEVKNAHARKWMHSFAELAHANRAPLAHEVSLQVTPIRAVVLFSHAESVVLHVASACSRPFIP
jgi:predicted alpha/beta-hydrolase family hydrolase